MVLVLNILSQKIVEISNDVNKSNSVNEFHEHVK